MIGIQSDISATQTGWEQIRRQQQRQQQGGWDRTKPRLNQQVPGAVLPITKHVAMNFVFHQFTLMAVLLVIGLISGMVIIIAVKQTREPACIPHTEALSTDDGFWVLLAQVFLQILSIFCTVYPVVLNQDLKDSVAIFWFVALLVISFLTTIAALAIYAWSWKGATILSFVAAFAQVISAGQLAISLDPRNVERKIVRRATSKLEHGHQD